jgi:hypothetical protein
MTFLYFFLKLMTLGWKPAPSEGGAFFYYTMRGMVLCMAGLTSKRVNRLTGKRISAFYTLFTRQLVYSFTDFAYAQNHTA